MDVIYLLKDSLGYYKIGFTKRALNKRIKEHHTACSEDLIVVNTFNTKHNRQVETALHNLYVAKHVKREFFSLSDGDVANFTSICQKIEDGLTYMRNHSLYINKEIY